MFFLYRIRLFPNQLFIWNITIVRSINWTREIVWVHLRHCDSTFSCKLLLGFLRGVWIGQVWVEVLVQDLRRLLAEVSPLSSSVKEPGTKDHHCLAGTLLQLDLRIRKYEKITTKRFWVSCFSSTTPSPVVQPTCPNNGLHPVPFLTLSREINPFRTHHLHQCQPHSRSFLAPQELYYLYQSEEYDSSICSTPALTPENSEKNMCATSCANTATIVICVGTNAAL